MNDRTELDGWFYDLEVYRQVTARSDAVRLIIPAYQPNESAKNILEVCIESVKRFTPVDDYELWVVDSNSPNEYSQWLRSIPGINIILNKTEPRPEAERRLSKRMTFWRNQIKWGSYANAVGIELAMRFISTDVKYVMTLHMDTMICNMNWLQFMLSHLNEKTKVVGACTEYRRIKEGVVHILGCLFDYQLARKLKLDTFPELPAIDVGDNITIGFRQVGYNVFACRNTYNNPEYAKEIPMESPFYNINVVRSFDDSGNIIFMHLGRGIPKAGMNYEGKTSSAEDWVAFFEKLNK